MVEFNISTETGIEIRAENCSVMEVLQIYSNATEAVMRVIERLTGESPEPLVTAAFKAALRQRDDFAKHADRQGRFKF
jgi:hypothetical protein